MLFHGSRILGRRVGKSQHSVSSVLHASEALLPFSLGRATNPNLLPKGDDDVGDRGNPEFHRRDWKSASEMKI
jgi:hypothetical protein